MPQLRDALAGGRRAGAQLDELPSDDTLVAANLAGELPRVQPLAAADLPGPVMAFHPSRQSLRMGWVTGDGGVLVAA
jgi:hypothetical protein